MPTPGHSQADTRVQAQADAAPQRREADGQREVPLTLREQAKAVRKAGDEDAASKALAPPRDLLTE